MKTVTYRLGDARESWSLTECRPRHLAGFVESIWHFEGALPYVRERHLPNGFLELVVQLGQRFHFVTGCGRELCPPISIAGLQTRSTLIEAPQVRACALGVRFHPAGAYAFAGGPINEFTDRLVSIDDVLGHAANEFAQRCVDLRDANGRVHFMARWLSSRIARSRAVDPCVMWSARLIERSHGRVSISQIQNESNLSKKQLIHRFREQIGVTPKLYARIIRLRQALTLLHEGSCAPDDVAAACGYYDQPHMNLDFRELAGLTPRDFTRSNRFSPTTLAGQSPSLFSKTGGQSTGYPEL
jgi:AraC-like DNA-binding protein